MFPDPSLFNATGQSPRRPPATFGHSLEPNAYIPSDLSLKPSDDFVSTSVEYAPHPALHIDASYNAAYLLPSGHWARPIESSHSQDSSSWDDTPSKFATPPEDFDPSYEAAIQSVFSNPNSPVQDHKTTPPLSYTWIQPSPSPSSAGSAYNFSPGPFTGHEIDPEENFGAASSSTQATFTFQEQITMFQDAANEPAVTYTGHLVPQQIYRPHTNADRRRYVEDVRLNAPIKFYVQNPGECGIPLKDALFSRTDRLLDRTMLMFEGGVGPSISIRLEWPGYRPWSRQIPTKDFKNPPGPITLAKLTKNVAKCVERFIKEMSNSTMEDETKKCWKVGTAGTCIKLEDLVLVSLHHVSMGSWQPQLRLRSSTRRV